MFGFLTFIVLFGINVWGCKYFSEVFGANENVKPYVGVFKVKHLGLVFLIPSYLSILTLVALPFAICFLAYVFTAENIKDFLNKPLFANKKKEEKEIGIVLDFKSNKDV
jgi:hypothetical protein